MDENEVKYCPMCFEEDGIKWTEMRHIKLSECYYDCEIKKLVGSVKHTTKMICTRCDEEVLNNVS